MPGFRNKNDPHRISGGDRDMLQNRFLWVVPYQDRKPIFGKRNFRYGPPA